MLIPAAIMVLSLLIKQQKKPGPKAQAYDANVYEGGGMKGALFPYAREVMVKLLHSKSLTIQSDYCN